MKPVANTMVGYVLEEPNDGNHGYLVGDKPTFLLRVFYPMKKEVSNFVPKGSIQFRTRAFPFILHPSIVEEVMSKKPWRGQFVQVTYFLEVVTKANEYRVLLYATNIERLLDDYPEARIDQNTIWLDANQIEEEIEDAEI